MDEQSTFTATELANRTGDIINQVYYGKRPAVVTRRGKPVVVIVDVEMWQEMQEREIREIPS